MQEIALTSMLEARTTLSDQVLMTPVLPIGQRTTPTGNPIYAKAENLQPSGSFKIRGALSCISRLTPEQRAAGVIAYSTGNHAQAVALAAAKAHIPATIVMSPDAPSYKIDATRRYGATVVMAGPSSQDRRKLAENLARERHLYLIPPYDHPDVIAGQATIGLELLEQMRFAAVFLPIGGGGLIAGIASAIKLSSPSVRVIGVEPEWENDAWQSFQRGTRVALPAASASIADAIRVQTLGDLTYPIIQRYVDDIVTVSEAEIAHATRIILEEAHLVVEPSAALGLAAALTYPRAFPSDQPIVTIASGGNTTLAALCVLLEQPGNPVA